MLGRTGRILPADPIARDLAVASGCECGGGMGDLGMELRFASPYVKLLLETESSRRRRSNDDTGLTYRFSTRNRFTSCEDEPMTRFRRSFPAVFAVVSMYGILSSPVLSQFDEMVKHVPSHANALFLVNAEKLFASEVAKSQNWQAQRGKRFDSGLTCLPANATRVVIGSQIDLEVMRPMWEAAIVEFPQAPTLADVSQHFGGIDDTIANTSVLRVADDSYVVRFSDQLLGAFGPGNRQLVSSWLAANGCPAVAVSSRSTSVRGRQRGHHPGDRCHRCTHARAGRATAGGIQRRRHLAMPNSARRKSLAS